MEVRNFVIMMIMASLSLTFVLLIALGLYHYRPDLIGLDSSSKIEKSIIKEDTLYVEPTVQITQQRYELLNEELLKKIRFKQEKDSLLRVSMVFLDSIEYFRRSSTSYKDSLLGAENRLSEEAKRFASLSDSLAKIAKNYDLALKKVKDAEARLDAQETFIEEELDSLTIKGYQEFAKIYNNSNPVEVAKILEVIDERDAAMILKKMSKRKAGKVIDAMDPQRAATILLLGAVE